MSPDSVTSRVSNTLYTDHKLPLMYHHLRFCIIMYTFDFNPAPSAIQISNIRFTLYVEYEYNCVKRLFNFFGFYNALQCTYFLFFFVFRIHLFFIIRKKAVVAVCDNSNRSQYV